MFINKLSWMLVPMAALVMTANTLPASANRSDENGAVMLILRGMADSENPRGQLDDEAALEYARRLGFRGEVLDVAGAARVHSPQFAMAIDRIHQDETVTAIYGFSAGGYNARLIWKKLTDEERERIEKVVVVGSPGVVSSDFPGKAEVVIQEDPEEGHLAGPRTLLESLDDKPAVRLDEGMRTTIAPRSSETISAKGTRTDRTTASEGEGTAKNRTSRDASAKQPDRVVKKTTRAKKTAPLSTTSDLSARD